MLDLQRFLWVAGGRRATQQLRHCVTALLAYVRSERMFCEQLDYNLLFRWFLDMEVAEPSFDHSSFSRNRARLLEHDVAREFFTRVVAGPQPAVAFG